MKNPVIGAYHADPFVMKHGDTYYMVPTTEATGWEGAKFHLFTSKDLETWSEGVEILDLKNLTWAHSMAWAPTLAEKDGYWYFIFAAEQQIGVAVAEKPEGPYRDVLDRPLIERDTLGIQAIDPSIFTDADGKNWFIWGSGRCFMSEIFLSPADVHLVGEVKCLSDDFYWQRSTGFERGFDPSIFCEGADLIRYRDRYLLTWSCYDTRDYRYRIRYAWADKVTGPYIQPLDDRHDNVLICAKGEVLGTGHGNVVEKDGALYVCYHRLALPRNGYHREVCCDRIVFEDDVHIHAEPTR